MIRKVAIANRGEIAVRIAYALREMGIEPVALFTDPDKDGLHVLTTREVHEISSYIDAKDIVRAAKEAGADAIHPGYGFLSENPSLAEECKRAGVLFIGPEAETIRTMGDKLESKRVMERAGVPVVPAWSGEPPPNEYPVLVKAVGGGGGKGMRLVESPAELKEALQSASREAASAFGDGRVFVEKYIREPRHIEFQIFGDAQGNAIHLFERECSIQRRHQKIIEETPSPVMTPELRSQMGAAAVAAARAVGYRNAGTVEFILDTSGKFYFLEMNTRLQVEHPVTEMTTGLDLVREQVLIASGHKLRHAQSNLRQTGHSMECRIYAEVPEENFRPATGTIELFDPPMGPGIRLDTGVSQGSVVSHHFDPLLAKLVVWAPTREASIDRMKRALDDFVLLGVRNNIDFLNRVISSADFRAGKLNTGFLAAHPELLAGPGEIPPEAVAAASVKTSRASAQADTFTDVWNSGGWRNS